MPPRKKASRSREDKSLEEVLWDAATALRSSMDAAEYKYVVLGLIFLKYVSDTFMVRHDELARLVDEQGSEYFMPIAKRNIVAGRKFSEMLAQSLNRYQNRTIDAAQVMAEIVEIAKAIKVQRKRGETTGLTERELAFYDALTSNESARLAITTKPCAPSRTN